MTVEGASDGLLGDVIAYGPMNWEYNEKLMIKRLLVIVGYHSPLLRSGSDIVKQSQWLWKQLS